MEPQRRDGRKTPVIHATGSLPQKVAHPPRPTAQRIRRACAKGMLGEAQKIYERGGVAGVRTSRGALTAQVDGHGASVSLYHYASGDCACGFGGNGVCQHAAAALMYAAENLDTLIADERKRMAGIGAVLEQTTLEQLKSFLVPELALDDDLRRRFVDLLGTADGAAADDPAGAKTAGAQPDSRKKLAEFRKYRMEARKTYAYHFDGFSGYNLGTDRLEDEARKKEREGRLAEAVLINREITEAISNCIGENTDLDGDYCYFFGLHLRKMASCIRRQRLSHMQKRQYISYMLEKFVNDRFDCDKYDYGKALRSICTSAEDLAYWRSLLEDVLEEMDAFSAERIGEHEIRRLLDMEMDLLEKIGDGSVEDIYRGYYRISTSVCSRYIWHLYGTDPDEARRIAAEALRSHPGAPWIVSIVKRIS